MRDYAHSYGFEIFDSENLFGEFPDAFRYSI